MEILNAIKQRTINKQVIELGKLIDDKYVLEPVYKYNLRVKEQKQKQKHDHLQDKKKELMQSMVENKLVEYVLNNSNLNAAETLLFEAKLKNKAESAYKTYETNYENIYKEDNKELYKKVENYETLVNYIKNKKQELGLTKDDANYRISYEPQEQRVMIKTNVRLKN